MLESRRLLHTHGDIHTLELIRPSRAKGSRLESYGILGRLPCVCAELCLTEAIAKLVHYNLAMLINQNALDDNGTKLIRPRKLRMHTAPVWPKGNGNLMALVRQHQSRIAQRVSDDPVPQHADHTLRPIPLSYWILCPNCETPKQAACIALYAVKTWRQLQCGACNSSITASRWMCPCKVLWHKCLIHRQNGFDCRRERRVKGQPTKARRRTLPPLGHEV